MDFIEILGWVRESGSRLRAIAHLSDDETVAKMGHPSALVSVGCGPPAYSSSFFMIFVPMRKVNMKTIAWAVAAARGEFMFIVLLWPVARGVGLCGFLGASKDFPILQ